MVKPICLNDRLILPLLASLVLILGLGIRLWRMEYIPFQTDADEMAYVFAGESLLDLGVPFSWSSIHVPGRHNWLNLYLGYPRLHAGDYFPMVYPWFDHPPLLPYLEGSLVRFFGYHFPQMVPSLLIRLPMILLAGLTLGFTYLLGGALFNPRTGLLAMTLVAFSPIFIIGQRMVTGENVYIPLILAALYLLVKRRTFGLFGSILLNTLAALSKITGLVGIVLTTLYLILTKRFREAVVVFAGSSLFFGLVYGLYGYTIDWHQFVLALQAQSGRFIGWSNPAFILSNPGFRYISMLDMSYYLILFLGIAFILLVEKTPADTFISLSVLGLFILVWITSAEQDNLGWYKMPLFIFLAIGAGQTLYRQRYPLTATALVFMAALSNIGLVRYPDHPLPEYQLMRIVVLGLFGLLLLPMLIRFKYINRFKVLMLITALTVYGITGIRAVSANYKVMCKDRACPIPALTLTRWLLNRGATGLP